MQPEHRDVALVHQIYRISLRPAALGSSVTTAQSTFNKPIIDSSQHSATSSDVDTTADCNL